MTFPEPPQKDDRDHTAGEEALLELAERCEREGPTIDLTRAIALALGWREVEHDNHIRYVDPDGEMWWIGNVAWLLSLDAAVTLVPEKWSWRADKNCSARVSNFSERYSSKAKTTALALCAAALRARAAIAKARRRT